MKRQRGENEDCKEAGNIKTEFKLICRQQGAESVCRNGINELDKPEQIKTVRGKYDTYENGEPIPNN